MNINHKKAKTGVGPRIKEWRKANGMKSFQLAKMIGVSQGSMSDIENNKNEPSAATIVKLLTHPDIEIDWRWLLTGEYGDIPTTEPIKPLPLVIEVKPGTEFLIRGKEKE